jgi:hypothetical protein
MKITNESIHHPAAGSRAEDSAQHKPHRLLVFVGLPVVVFLLSLVFARLANPVSFADHPERSMRRAAIVTLVLATIALVGRSFNRPWDEH